MTWNQKLNKKRRNNLYIYIWIFPVGRSIFFLWHFSNSMIYIISQIIRHIIIFCPFSDHLGLKIGRVIRKKAMKSVETPLKLRRPTPSLKWQIDSLVSSEMKFQFLYFTSAREQKDHDFVHKLEEYTWKRALGPPQSNFFFSRRRCVFNSITKTWHEINGHYVGVARLFTIIFLC